MKETEKFDIRLRVKHIKEHMQDASDELKVVKYMIKKLEKQIDKIESIPEDFQI